MKNKCIFTSLIIMIIFSACQNEKEKTFTNKPHYTIEVGDTLKIYYSTNSCCQYCQPNADQLKHLSYAGSKIIETASTDCMGCNQISALLFIATSKGIDTIQDGTIAPSAICSDSIKGLKNYVIKIK